MRRLETRQQKHWRHITENIDCGQRMQETVAMMRKICILMIYLCVYDEIVDLFSLKKASMAHRLSVLKRFNKVRQQKFSFGELLPEILKEWKIRNLKKFFEIMILNLHL